MSNQNTEYIVSLDRFEGPLDLLYQLIERRKLQINSISLAKVTADFIAHLRNVPTIPIEEVAHFAHIASLLILIKSKSLLPILEYTKEEESDVTVLEDRMRLFSYIQERAVPALNTWGKTTFIVRPPKQERDWSFSPDASCTARGLKHNALSIIRDLAFLKEPPKKKIGRIIPIEKVIEKVMSAVTERVSVSFRDLVKPADKCEKIVSFLAVLELMRKNLLVATQCGQFDDIMVTKGRP